MGIELEPNGDLEKSKYMNTFDEAYGLICLSISQDLFFHLESLTTPNQVCTKLESLFEKQDELSGHLLDNWLISLSPSSFKTIHEFFTKFKSLAL